MKIAREIRLLFWRKMLETLREPAWIFSGLTTPLLYLALFSPLLNNLKASWLGASGTMDIFVPGILALMAFGAGMGAGWIVVWELQSGVIERFSAAPVSRFSLLMGTVLRDIVMFVVPASLVLVVAAFFGFHLHLAGLAVLFLLQSMLTAVVSGVSGSLGLILKNIGSLAAVVTSVQLPITLLGGILLPLSIGPSWLRLLAHANPMYYVVEASRVLAGGAKFNDQVLQAFLVMVPLTVVTLGWSTRVFRKVIA